MCFCLRVGDAMCQQALHLMKTAVKTASQHKQKILIRVNMNGVTLVDSASNVSVKFNLEHVVPSVQYLTPCWNTDIRVKNC